MASRYWVGGTATWDGTAGTKWATTTGGAGGAAVPTSADDVFLDANSGSGTVSVGATGSPTCLSLNCTGFTGTLAFGGNNLTANGSFTAGSGMTITTTSGQLNLSAASGAWNITTNGKSLPMQIQAGVAGSTASYTLQDNYTSTSGFNCIVGLDLNNKNVTLSGSFDISGSITRTVTMGSGTVQCTTFVATTITGLTFNKNTFVLKPTSGTSDLGTLTINDVNPSGSGTLGISNGTVTNLDFTVNSFTGTYSAVSCNVMGNLTLSSGMSFAGGGTITMGATSGTKTITSNGKVFGMNLTIDGVGGTFQFADAFDLSTRTMTLTNGTLNGNNQDIGVGIFSSSNSNSRTINLGTGTWTLKGTTGTLWNLATSTNCTVNASTSTIKITAVNINALVFNGGGLTYNKVWFSRGTATGINTVSSSNTFAELKDDGSVAHTLRFTAGTTQTITTWSVSGNGAGNEIAINSTSTAVHNLVKAGGGTVSADYLDIQHSVATPGSTWYAGTHSIDNQATATAGSGWIFTAAPGGTSVHYLSLLGVGN